MTYLVAAFIVTWFTGFLFFGGLYLNEVRLVLNNLASGPTEKQPSSAQLLHALATTLPFAAPPQGLGFMAAMILIFRFSSHDRFRPYCMANVDPATINETGRSHLLRSIRRERVLLAWVGCGLMFVLCVSIYYTFS